MVLLLIFAVVAGAATALSPCVLPVLPVALASGATGGPRRPLGVATGLALTFTFATALLVYVIDALGLPDELVRWLAILVLIGFGIALIFPGVAARIEAPLTRLAGRAPGAGRQGDGFWSGVLLGGSLGLVYAPCAGPILAGVITVSATQPLSAQRLAVAAAYGIGSALVLYGLLLGGRRLTSRLAHRTATFQMAMGVVMVLAGFAMLGDLDQRFQTAIAAHLPSSLVTPSERLETTAPARDRLADLRGGEARAASGTAQAAAGADLPVLGDAPEFPDGDRTWLNSRPLTLAGLRGRVVLVDFWTYSCINCLRTLPYLKAWDARYRRDGLTIVGVHTPEFPFERVTSNVRAAIARTGIRYPVVQDNDQAIWNAWGNQYWPASYLIDAQGRVRLVHFGEGDYAEKERAIQALLREAGRSAPGGVSRPRAETASDLQITPETYLVPRPAQSIDGDDLRLGTHDYGTPPDGLPRSHIQFAGTWRIAEDQATAIRAASVSLHFRARRVFLVLGPPVRGDRRVRVLLGGRPIPAAAAGSDVRDGVVTVGAYRLYRLVDLPEVADGQLRVELPPGTTAYAFTFG